MILGTIKIAPYAMMVQVVEVMNGPGMEEKDAKTVVIKIGTILIGKIKMEVSQEPAHKVSTIHILLA